MTRPDFIRSLGDKKPTSINMMVYGYPGIGKTPFWGTGGRGLLLMDSDHGTESAMVAGSVCDTASVFDYNRLDEVYAHLAYENEDRHYKWVTWDSLSLFMDRSLIDDLTADAHSRNPKTQSKWVPSKREYMEQQSRVAEAVRKFCALPIHFGISCHVATEEDPEGNLMYVPMIPGQGGEFGSKIRGYMNVVCYMQVTGTGTLRMVTKSANGYFARDRFGALSTVKERKRFYYIDNPTVPMVEQKIKEKLVGKGTNQGRQGRRRAG